MKRILCAALVMTLAVLSLPRLFPVSGDMSGDAAAAATPVPDSGRQIRLLSGGEVTQLCVSDYLAGVVAAEMPASFEPEALKAQAVAARSYLQRAAASPKHEGADICSDAACCQAYLSPGQLRESWGERYDGYAQKISAAVAATDGEYLSYDGQPALAAFHSSSDGATEDAAALWSDVPYLKSVSSPETEENVPDLCSSVVCSELDFRDTVLHLVPEADMTGPASGWVGEIKRTGSGRVASAVIGGAELTGSQLRELFSLRSTDFELGYDGLSFVFTVHGYGHGVGMSQYGANAMAASGADYRSILSHYYPGTSLAANRCSYGYGNCRRPVSRVRRKPRQADSRQLLAVSLLCALCAGI